MNRLFRIYAEYRLYKLNNQIKDYREKIEVYKRFNENILKAIDKENKLLSQVEKQKDNLKKQLLAEEKNKLAGILTNAN